MTVTILKEGICTCIYEPRGDYGLEGYQLNDSYIFEIRKNDKDQTYYKVYPGSPAYGETCSKKVFNKCFKIITEKELNHDSI